MRSIRFILDLSWTYKTRSKLIHKIQCDSHIVCAFAENKRKASFWAILILSKYYDISLQFCTSYVMMCSWDIATDKSSRPEMFCQKGILRNFANFTGKHLCQGFFVIKKATLPQVFSCKFCKIFKNSFFRRTRPVAASELKLR